MKVSHSEPFILYEKVNEQGIKTTLGITEWVLDDSSYEVKEPLPRCRLNVSFN